MRLKSRLPYLRGEDIDKVRKMCQKLFVCHTTILGRNEIIILGGFKQKNAAVVFKIQGEVAEGVGVGTFVIDISGADHKMGKNAVFLVCA